MSEKMIFPAEIAEFTVEHHFYQHNARSKIIYLIVLFFFVAAVVSLFFIRVNISVNGNGILTSVNERNMVKAPASGRINKVYVRLNQPIKAGEILFSIQSDILEEQAGYLSKRREEIHQRIKDLEKLTLLKPVVPEGNDMILQSPLYSQQLNLYKQQYQEAQLQLKNTETTYQRNKILHGKKVISDAEFDKVQFEYDKALSSKKLIYEQQMSQWHADLNDLHAELMELSSQKERFDHEQDQYTVKAPINGSIQQFNGILPGNFVNIGETVAEISPDSGLIANVHVRPKDIGLLQQDMPVNLQIDAFNYHEWGMVKGEVMDISKDVYLDEHQGPLFQVKCKLNSNTLSLPNGYEGELKKGMSIQARFQVTKRTLFQLLYDKVDNWLNPAQRQATDLQT
ncbi:HlyD family efflux transporter periplasmic adaptor subunit [Olivibacter sp. SDN3]|uniref:HlyD family secretion protein n=1 Tax=Olivibacter sp. SDN3 TaxID=2764720 RepID=UPI001651AE28|nr:HlyD family efflux transporter periplasmic adaptor subunit [Olivibacter sp. SDN3]QNL51725.1 HlyD family efflux transporter periplasmic adaptor subunit [Olivibacter sp. SDN3]